MRGGDWDSYALFILLVSSIIFLYLVLSMHVNLQRS